MVSLNPNQRHYSDPFVSASLLEVLQCRKRSLANAANPTSCLHPKAQSEPGHATDCQRCTSAQNQSLLSPRSSSHQHSHHDSASHSTSSLLPGNSQPPSERRLRVTRGPRAQHQCKACMSVLLRDRAKGGGSLGHAHPRSLSTCAPIAPASEPCTPTSPHRSESPSVALPPVLSNSSPSLLSQTNLLTSPLRRPSPPHAVPPGSLYEGGDLSLLNHCLHHIVSRRTSSPTLTERTTNYPLLRHGDIGNIPIDVELIYKSQSLDVALFCSPNLDRRLQLLPNDLKDRPDPLVGHLT
ncbi:uncharacterized protein LOC114854990 [Betta splendens]|uniref:Uncharacterized protein LOC114854990 n=1 Tax=Betta splendens TaxID=158456 RepID=A0A6P7MG87_BETSP|nr:uncharacterized protein LOC114854990 [Betta splendens]